MQSSLQTAGILQEELAKAFFLESAGDWHSQRRYYSLKTSEVQEVESYITVRFLDRGSPELIQLAQMHELEDDRLFICGSQVTWESNYTEQNRKPMTGSTIFGIAGEIMYRDRGFATRKPITARYNCPNGNSKTLHLRTEYNGSSFEEELKLIGQMYRTRQTIICRENEEQTIGQYLEKRIG